MNDIYDVIIRYRGSQSEPDTWRGTPEQMRDILNDYCRAKIDAKNIEAGRPLWVDVADKAQERRPKCVVETWL